MFYGTKNFGEIEYIETNYSRLIEKIKNKHGRFNIFYENREEGWGARVSDINICFFNKKIYFYKNDVFLEIENKFDYFYFVSKKDDIFMDANDSCFERKEDTFCYNMDTIVISNSLTMTIVYNEKCDSLESKVKNISKQEDEPLFNFIEKNIYLHDTKDILAKHRHENSSYKIFNIKDKNGKYLCIKDLRINILWYSKLCNTYIYKRRYPLLAEAEKINKSMIAYVVEIKENTLKRNESKKIRNNNLSSDLYFNKCDDCDDIPF